MICMIIFKESAKALDHKNLSQSILKEKLLPGQKNGHGHYFEEEGPSMVCTKSVILRLSVSLRFKKQIPTR